MKTQLFETKEQAIGSANELVNESIELVDFTTIEKAIINGVDCNLIHLYLSYTALTCDGYLSQLNECCIHYDAKTNKIHHSHTPTTLLQKSFELISIVDDARSFAKQTAKEDLKKEFGRIWIHNGRKFVQI